MSKKTKQEKQDAVNKHKKRLSWAMTYPPTVSSGVVANIYSKTTFTGNPEIGDVVGLDGPALTNELVEACDEIKNGDISGLAAILTGQAYQLQALSALCITKACQAEYMERFEAYTRIGMKAQDSCRKTVLAIGELKNPKKTTFIRQQNNANQQIVSNGAGSLENPKNSDSQANELLEVIDGERLDFGTAAATSGIDTELEAVGASHRAEN